MKKFDSFCVQYDEPKVDVTCLIGKTIVEVDVSKDEFWIETSDGWVYLMYHDQDCCESVEIEDMDEDPNVLVGGFVVNAEEVEGVVEDTDWGSQTWTFYKIDTNKGGITIRWLGESNGYYSESVDFIGKDMSDV